MIQDCNRQPRRCTLHWRRTSESITVQIHWNVGTVWWTWWPHLTNRYGVKWKVRFFSLARERIASTQKLGMEADSAVEDKLKEQMREQIIVRASPCSTERSDPEQDLKLSCAFLSGSRGQLLTFVLVILLLIINWSEVMVKGARTANTCKQNRSQSQFPLQYSEMYKKRQKWSKQEWKCRLCHTFSVKVKETY